MKKLSKFIWMPLVLLAGTTIVLSSCKKYLEKSPLSDINPTQAYQNYRNFQGYTEELYNCIPLLTGSTSHNMWNFGEEEFWEQDNRLFAYQLDRGNYFAWQGTVFGSWFKASGNPSGDAASNSRGAKDKLWGLSWYAIRKANVGLDNLDLMKDATEEEKKLIQGQLYFFRGWFHFMILQYWGGIPYVDRDLAGEVMTLPRLTYQQTAEKVSADLLKAAELLPVDWDQTEVGKLTLGRNNFRANKIMAMAFHAKNLLLAGSPLMEATTKGLMPSTASTSDYNKEYCKRAAAAFAETLKLIESTGRYQLAAFSDYSKLFYTVNQGNATPGLKESIFIENTAEHNSRFNLNQVNDYRPFSVVPQGIKCHPTANYIDNYGMANGMPLPADITKPDPESGWDPEFPWRNRDPRFYNDIMIDGEKLVNNGSIAQVGNNEFIQYASMFTGGLHRVNQGSGGKQMWTGYMLTKFEPRITNDFENTKGAMTVDLALLRLADVYLMFAEAVSEGYGSPTAKVAGYDLSAVDAINKIRDRAGVGRVAAKFLTSQDAFRPEYRRERAVELAFEGHRFVDLRRWLLLTQRPYTLKNSVEFLRATPNPQVYANPRNARVSNFREETIFERQFSDKHYWFPFQVKDVSLYAGFGQNLGW